MSLLQTASKTSYPSSRRSVSRLREQYEESQHMARKSKLYSSRSSSHDTSSVDEELKGIVQMATTDVFRQHQQSDNKAESNNNDQSLQTIMRTLSGSSSKSSFSAGKAFSRARNRMRSSRRVAPAASTSSSDSTSSHKIDISGGSLQMTVDRIEPQEKVKKKKSTQKAENLLKKIEQMQNAQKKIDLYSQQQEELHQQQNSKTHSKSPPPPASENNTSANEDTTTQRQKLLQRISAQNRKAGASVSVAGATNFSVATAKASNIQSNSNKLLPPEEPNVEPKDDAESRRLTRSVYRNVSSRKRSRAKASLLNNKDSKSRNTESALAGADSSVVARKGSRKDRRTRQNANLNKASNTIKNQNDEAMYHSFGDGTQSLLSYSADDEERYFTVNSLEESQSDDDDMIYNNGITDVDRYAIEESMGCLMDKAYSTLAQGQEDGGLRKNEPSYHTESMDDMMNMSMEDIINMASSRLDTTGKGVGVKTSKDDVKSDNRAQWGEMHHQSASRAEKVWNRPIETWSFNSFSEEEQEIVFEKTDRNQEPPGMRQDEKRNSNLKDEGSRGKNPPREAFNQLRKKRQTPFRVLADGMSESEDSAIVIHPPLNGAMKTATPSKPPQNKNNAVPPKEGKTESKSICSVLDDVLLGPESPCGDAVELSLPAEKRGTKANKRKANPQSPDAITNQKVYGKNMLNNAQDARLFDRNKSNEENETVVITNKKSEANDQPLILSDSATYWDELSSIASASLTKLQTKMEGNLSTRSLSPVKEEKLRDENSCMCPWSTSNISIEGENDVKAQSLDKGETEDKGNADDVPISISYRPEDNLYTIPKEPPREITNNNASQSSKSDEESYNSESSVLSNRLNNKVINEEEVAFAMKRGEEFARIDSPKKEVSPIRRRYSRYGDDIGEEPLEMPALGSFDTSEGSHPILRLEGGKVGTKQNDGHFVEIEGVSLQSTTKHTTLDKTLCEEAEIGVTKEVIAKVPHSNGTRERPGEQFGETDAIRRASDDEKPIKVNAVQSLDNIGRILSEDASDDTAALLSAITRSDDSSKNGGSNYEEERDNSSSSSVGDYSHSSDVAMGGTAQRRKMALGRDKYPSHGNEIQQKPRESGLSQKNSMSDEAEEKVSTSEIFKSTAKDRHSSDIINESSEREQMSCKRSIVSPSGKERRGSSNVLTPPDILNTSAATPLHQHIPENTSKIGLDIPEESLPESRIPQKRPLLEAVKKSESTTEIANLCNNKHNDAHKNNVNVAAKLQPKNQVDDKTETKDSEDCVVVDITGWVTKHKLREEQSQSEFEQASPKPKVVPPAPEASMVFPWQISSEEEQEKQKLPSGTTKSEGGRDGGSIQTKDKTSHKSISKSQIKARYVATVSKRENVDQVSQISPKKSDKNKADTESMPKTTFMPTKAKKTSKPSSSRKTKNNNKDSIKLSSMKGRDEDQNNKRSRSVRKFRENLPAKKNRARATRSPSKTPAHSPTPAQKKTDVAAASQTSMIFPWQISPEKERQISPEKEATSRRFSPKRKKSVVLPWQVGSRKTSPDGSRQSYQKKSSNKRDNVYPEKPRTMNNRTRRSKSPFPEDVELQSLSLNEDDGDTFRDISFIDDDDVSLISLIDSIPNESDRKANLNKYRDEILRVKRKLSPEKARKGQNRGYLHDQGDLSFYEGRESQSTERLTSPGGKVRFDFQRETEEDPTPSFPSVFQRVGGYGKQEARATVTARAKTETENKFLRKYPHPSFNYSAEETSMADLRQKFENYDSLVDQLVNKTKMQTYGSNTAKISYTEFPGVLSEQVCELAEKRKEAKKSFHLPKNHSGSRSPALHSKTSLMKSRAKSVPTKHSAGSSIYHGLRHREATSDSSTSFTRQRSLIPSSTTEVSLKGRINERALSPSKASTQRQLFQYLPKLRSKSALSERSAPSPESGSRLQKVSSLGRESLFPETAGFDYLAEKRRLLMERKRLLEQRKQSSRKEIDRIIDAGKNQVKTPSDETPYFSQLRYQEESGRSLNSKPKRKITSPEKKRLLGKYSNQTRELKRDLDLARLTSHSIRNANAQLSGEMKALKTKLSKQMEYRKEERALMETCHKGLKHLRRRIDDSKRQDNENCDTYSEITFDSSSDDLSEIREVLLTNLKMMHDAREELLWEQFCIIEGRDDGDAERLNDLESLMEQIKVREDYHSELVLKALQQADETNTISRGKTIFKRNHEK